MSNILNWPDDQVLRVSELEHDYYVYAEVAAPHTRCPHCNHSEIVHTFSAMQFHISRRIMAGMKQQHTPTSTGCSKGMGTNNHSFFCQRPYFPVRLEPESSKLKQYITG
ncbi:hypothetical protein [Xenorhabdus bovienii]|uniref:hypothetical protein n=1 Tax=Xenorhabdus bovienii TaxID=40576 RepID=UPI0023B2A81E|nr:hypothetical protein [Xenorhabdus bovienii]